MKFSFFTIGHSTRPIGEFIDLLTASEIGIVVGVRTVPRSRTGPPYNREALPESLSGFQIAYEHVAELGGLRARAKDIAPDVNAFWQNRSFHNYADYAMSRGFRSGLARLRALGRVRRWAVMCRRQCGGGAIVGSSRTISPSVASRCFIFLGRARSQ
jgi:uncharacterized protein (DUF488 family)